MICTGVPRPLPKSGRCPLAAHTLSVRPFSTQPQAPPRTPRQLQKWRTPGAQRTWRRASAVPSQPGDSGLGASAASRPQGGGPGAPETNGAPVGAAFSSSSSTAAAGRSTAGASTASGSSAIQSRTRGNFRSVLKRTYLGELLFVVIGSAVCAALAHWTVGTSLRRFNPYSFSIVLPEAPGVQLGTPVRMKGVAVGSAISATPMLDRVRVEVEVNEAKTIIPRDARFELTQSGMIPSSSIDITTPDGASAEALESAVAARSASAAASIRLASPKDVVACRLQGVLVCQGDEMEGFQGGSMDELTARMLKSLREGEEEAQAAGAAIVPGRGPMQG